MGRCADIRKLGPLTVREDWYGQQPDQETMYRANSPFTRPGTVPYAHTSTPRNTEYAGG